MKFINKNLCNIRTLNTEPNYKFVIKKKYILSALEDQLNFY